MKQIASLGGGKASTAMILMSLHGELDPLDAIIFADTGAERQTTLDTVERLKEYAGGGFGVPLYIVRSDKLPDIITNALDPTHKRGDLPFFTVLNGKKKQLGKYCTGEFKTQPVRRFIRNDLKEKFNASHKNPINLWLGYTMDEVTRQRKGKLKWEIRRYPLIEKRLYRHHCEEYLEKHGWTAVERSACYVCPYRRNKEYRNMPETEIQKAIAFEEAVNQRGMITETQSEGSKLYLHPSMQPLSERPFEEPDQPEFEELCGGASCYT